MSVSSSTYEIIETDKKDLVIFYDDSGEEVETLEREYIDEIWPDFIKDLDEIDNRTKEKQGDRNISLSVIDRAVIDIKSLQERDKLVLNPEWQRNYVWGRKTASLLIESLLLDIPVPAIYLAESLIDKQIKMEVVDGRQRLTSILHFLNNKFKLSGLDILKDLNGKKYSDLLDTHRDTLNERTLRMILIKKESDESTKLDLFYRINTGSSKLTKQEVRNAYFSKTKMQAKIAEVAKNLFELGFLPEEKNSFIKRYKHYELISRLIGFDLAYYKKIEYKGKIDELIMDAYKFDDDKFLEERVDTLKSFFKWLNNNKSILLFFSRKKDKIEEESNMEIKLNQGRPSFMDALYIIFIGGNISQETINFKSILDRYLKLSDSEMYLFTKSNPSTDSHNERIEIVKKTIKG